MFHTRRFTDAITYRTESLAIFAAFTNPLSTPQKALLDTQVGLLITDGSWAASDVIVFAMFVDGQQSLINWKSPGTFNGLAVNFSTSFVTKVGYPGVLANSTYIRTQYTPYSNGVQWTQNNAKALVYVKDNVQDDGRACGGISNGNTLIRPRDTSNQFIGRLNGASHTGASNSSGDGLFSVSTSDGANLLLKRNNSTIGTVASATTGVTNTELLIYAFGDAASPTVTPNYYINNNTIQCYAFGSSAMNDATFKTVRDNLTAGL